MELAAARTRPALPSSWRACQTMLAASGLRLDAADVLGFGPGIGWGFRASATPLLVGYGGHDPLQDLTLTVGSWLERHNHCGSVEHALGEMRAHLERERSQILVALAPEPDVEPPEHDLVQPIARSFVCVTAIVDDTVTWVDGLDAAAREMTLEVLHQRLAGHERAWAVLVGSGSFVALDMRLRTALRRTLHRLRVGFRNASGGLGALNEFSSALSSRRGDLPLRASLQLSAALGGGFGRGLFADFLRRHFEGMRLADALEDHYRELDAGWRAFEHAASHTPAEFAALAQSEHAGAEKLEAFCATAPWGEVA